MSKFAHFLKTAVNEQDIQGAKMAAANLPPSRCSFFHLQDSGETALHALLRIVRKKLEEDHGSPETTSLAKLAAWMMERGAPLNVKNAENESVIDVGGETWNRWLKTEPRFSYLKYATSLGDMISRMRNIVPKLSLSQHKGQCGRVGVVGGSAEYTGAPYYAAMSSLKTGADLSFVFCTDGAAVPIKCYSPELIVYPVYNPSKYGNGAVAEMVESIKSPLSRLHTLIIGPGLGRDESLLFATATTIELAKKQNLGLVVDADGLYLLSQQPQLLKGYKNAIVTPNSVEFSRLCASYGVSTPHHHEYESDLHQMIEETKSLGKAMQGPTVLRKGKFDIIANETDCYVSATLGAPRRCGGQGDVLAGVCATWLAWALDHAHHKHQSSDVYIPDAAFAASVITKRCSRRAFAIKNRSMTSPDLITEIGAVFEELVPAADNGLTSDGIVISGWEETDQWLEADNGLFTSD